MEANLTGSRIISIWLNTGKKIDTNRGYILTDKGVLVRSGDNKVLAVTPTAIATMELSFDDKKSIDELFQKEIL